MYLKRLEIQGFKSFARKTVLEFEPGITAIVGPNGSGKSNVADSVRWVLGEQSNKLLRGKKGDDVIFAGSDKRGKLGLAEVTATYDNRDRILPVDSAEVSIGRRIDRSGESEYLINGNKVRLLDVIDLLLKSTLGTSRYTIIGQGTIDQMVLAGPGEVKNLIDEASGVKAYYVKRERTLRRLEQTAQNLMRAEDLLSELEPRVKSLRRQAKRMEARESVEQELKVHRRELLAGQYWQLHGLTENLSQNIAGAREATRQEIQQKIEDIQARLNEAKGKREQAASQAAERQKNLTAIEQNLQKLYQQLQQPQIIDWKAVERELSSLDQAFSALQSSLSSADAAGLRRAAENLSGVWGQFRDRVKTPGQTESSLAEVKQQLVAVSAQKDALTAEFNRLSIAESQAKTSADFLQQQLDEASRESSGTARDHHSELEIEKAKLDTQLEVVVADIRHGLGDDILDEITKNKVPPPAADLQEKIDKLQRQLDLIGGVDELTLQEYREAEARFDSLNGQVEDLKKSMNDLRSIMDELDQHIKETFNQAFARVNEKFEYYFRVLFNGGRAYLSMIRSQDPALAEDVEQELEQDEQSEHLRPEQKIVAKYDHPTSVTGVDIKATPPGKKLASIQALSGGERALTSIALLCSLLACFPSPFVVLDEVDAALDEANTIRFGQILATLAHQTQFINITHNRETMRQSKVLYGVTMGDDGISKLLSIKFDQAAAYAK